MSKLRYLLLLLLIPLFLCSWVDSDTADIFTGKVVYLGGDESISAMVTRLSGDCRFFLTTDSHFVYDDTGYLINAGADQISGSVLASNGNTYNVRWSSLSDCQIQIPYVQNGISRTVWVNYGVLTDYIPSNLDVSSLAIISISVSVIVFGSFLILSKEVI